MAFPVQDLTSGDPVASVAHVVQIALTPIFLLSGIGTLIGVFNTRLARVSDHTEHASELLRGDPTEAERRRLNAHMVRLRLRLLALDAAVALGALGGAATCGAAFVLFLGGLRDTAIASWLFILFGAALGCVVGALVAFMFDTLLAWHGMRRDGPLPHPRMFLVRRSLGTGKSRRESASTHHVDEEEASGR
jgi:hypothetical protein